MNNAVPEFDILFRVKPEFTWIRAVDDATRSYLAARAFPRTLITQISISVTEALEQLVTLCIRQKTVTPFEVGLAWQQDVVQVHIIYATSIPLNPHQEPNYEVPSTGATEADQLEGLWLHLIKRTMDRVFFRIDGDRASLVIMKYGRAEQQARQLWVMSLTPKLRGDLSIEYSPEEAGRPTSGNTIIHDPLTQKVLRLSPSDAFILQRLDGKNTMEDAYLEHAVERGPIAPEQIKQLYEVLEANGMLENATTAERGKTRWQRWLSPVFSIPHPDAAVTWVHHYTRFLLNPVGFIILFLIGLSGLIPLITNWSAIVHIIEHIDELFLQSPVLIAIMYPLMLVSMTVHEFAHGVTCKHFGGRVRKLGVIWYMAMFIFFCDTTSSWTFPRKAQRIWVSLAGPLVSWALLGVAAWCAGETAAVGNSWAGLWVALTIVLAFGIVMNFNPLIRMDAYYILMDWTDIPNLQKKSLDYLTAGLLGWLKKPAAPAKPPISLREKRIFVIYGVLSAFMSFFFILLPFWRWTELWITRRDLGIWHVTTCIAVILIAAGLLQKVQRLSYAARHQEYKIL